MKKFEDWYNDLEGFSLRSERFYWDVGFDSPHKHSYNIALQWLRAAYEQGYSDGKEAKSDSDSGTSG